MFRLFIGVLLVLFTSSNTFAVTLAEALNSPTLTFATGGNANWFIESTNTHDGEFAVQSGMIGDSQSTWIQTQISGSGTLSFWWKVSSETFDHLTVYLDGVQQKYIAGTTTTVTNWSQYSIIVPSGVHIIKWVYAKDFTSTSGSDTAWIDQVNFTSDNPTISVKFSGNGNGSVNSSPINDISCIKGETSNCSSTPLTKGSVVTLTATPDNNTSVFDGWGSVCSTNPCDFIMSTDIIAVASFSLAPKIKLQTDDINGYGTFIDAYNNATSSIYSMNSVLSGDWTLGGSKDIILTGGYLADFKSITQLSQLLIWQ